MAIKDAVRPAPVCGNCEHAIAVGDVPALPGYPRIDHGKVDASRFCRRFPRQGDAPVVNVREPACGEFHIVADPRFVIEARKPEA